MLPLDFLVIASWRDESGAALLIGVHVIVAGIATGVLGLLLRWGRRPVRCPAAVPTGRGQNTTEASGKLTVR
jgi:hypothetical protein